MRAAAGGRFSDARRAISSGCGATFVVVVGLMVLDRVVPPDDSVTPLDERQPALLVVTWPQRLWELVSDDFLFVCVSTLLTYVTIFSLAAYFVIRRRGRPPRLS